MSDWAMTKFKNLSKKFQLMLEAEFVNDESLATVYAITGN